MSTFSTKHKLYLPDGSDFVEAGLEVGSNFDTIDEMPSVVGLDSDLPVNARFVGDEFYAVDKKRLYIGNNSLAWDIAVNQPMGYMYYNVHGGQTIQHQVVTPLDYNIVYYDTDGMCDIAANAIVIPHTGCYFVEVGWSNIVTWPNGTFHSTLLKVNNLERYEHVGRHANATALGFMFSHSCLINLNKGDTLRGLAYQSTGGPQQTNAGAHGWNKLVATYMGGLLP